MLFGGSKASSAGPAPPSYEPPPPDFQPPTDTWKVEGAFLEESSRLVPASPDDIDEITRSAFLSKTFKENDWVDLDAAQYGLGVALDIFPPNSDFQSLKWVFWTENALNKKLVSLLQALARPESHCLDSRTQPDFQFRRSGPPI